MSQDNVEIIRRMLDAFNHDDLDAVLAAFDADCELYEPPELLDRPALGFRGYDGIRQWMENLRGIADVRFESRGFTANGDIILSEWVAHGRGQASGVPVQWTTFTVLQMREGKIARAQGFLTSDEAREAAGRAE